MYNNSLSVNTEELKEMAEVLRPLLKYAKKKYKEKLLLQNIIFTIEPLINGEQKLMAAAVNGSQCLEYTFSASPGAAGDCVFVLGTDQVEKIVKSFCDIDDCEKVTFNIECNDDSTGCFTGHLEAISNIPDSAVIRVPVSVTENIINPFWEALGCADYRSILTSAYRLNDFSLSINSNVLKPIVDGLDKIGNTRITLRSDDHSGVYHLSSIDQKVEGVVMGVHHGN